MLKKNEIKSITLTFIHMSPLTRNPGSTPGGTGPKNSQRNTAPRHHGGRDELALSAEISSKMVGLHEYYQFYTSLPYLATASIEKSGKTFV